MRWPETHNQRCHRVIGTVTYYIEAEFPTDNRGKYKMYTTSELTVRREIKALTRGGFKNIKVLKATVGLTNKKLFYRGE